MSKYKWNVKDNEARIILTTNCNYKCIFCHSEGFDPYTQCKWTPDKKQLLKIVSEVLELGCTDITLTGGEPLIYKDLVLAVVAYVAETNEKAKVTIVSNASLLKKEWICELSRYSNIRFNISLHTADPGEYERLTAQKHCSLLEVQEKLIWLTQAGIPFKLNVVAMRETISKETIAELIEFSVKVKAAALKFIELLIMEQQESLFKSYISNSSIVQMLPRGFLLTNKNERRDEYFSREKQITIELQKCRCRFGCKQCMEVTTTCLNANGEFFPCFEYSGKSFDITKTPIDKVLEQGMAVIESLADKFGDDSPSLIKDVLYIERRKELYLAVPEDIMQNEDLKEVQLLQKREYSDYYFLSPLPAIDKTVQMRVHHGDKENAKLIISTSQTEESHNLTYTSRIFQDKNRVTMTDTPDFIINTMKHLGWNVSHRVKTFEDEYQYKDLKFQILRLNSGVTLIRVFLDDNTPLSLLQTLISINGVSSIEENIDLFYRKNRLDKNILTS